MRRLIFLIQPIVAAILALAAGLTERTASEGRPYRFAPQVAAKSFAGFDRNEYPGDEALAVLRKSFAFASYWLSAPPGEKTNSWSGKRAALQAQGFGFLLLYRGRTSSQLTKQICVDAGSA